VLSIRLPRLELDDLLVQLERAGRRSVAVCEAGERRTADGLQLIYRGPGAIGGSMERSLESIVARGLRPLLVWWGRDFPPARVVQSWVGDLELAGSRRGAVLAVVEQDEDVVISGLVLDKGKVQPLDWASLPGPGMLRSRVWPLWRPPSEDELGGRSQQRPVAGGGAGEVAREGRWSRLQMAVGDGSMPRGQEVLKRAAELRAFVLGCGRAGELMVWRLAENGIGDQGALVLADSDLVDAPNLGGILPARAVGMPKAQAVSAISAGLSGHRSIIPMIADLGNRAVVGAIAESDVLFTCVDNAEARLAAAILCSRYGIVHVDIAGGAAYTQSRRVAIGGEVRVALPGSSGCVACMENADWSQAVGRLSMSADEQRRRRTGQRWWEQRPGSWHDVLLPVVGEAVQELFRVLQGKRRRSVWLHYAHGNEDLPVWEDWSRRLPFRSAPCRACSQDGLRGLGDLGL